jgi:hypothetical protein
MPGPWISADHLIGKAESKFGRSLTDTAASAANVQELAVSAVGFAYGQIASILLNRGWSLADLDRWDYRTQYLEKLALYWLFLDLSLDGFDQSRLAPYDIREELTKPTFSVVSGGTTIQPSQGATGVDGTDVNGASIPGGEVFGTSAVAVGSFSQRLWPIKRNSRL